MATIGTLGKVTLIDIAKAMGPDGKILKVAELLTQSNEILYDMPWKEGNMPTGHKAAIRTGLPTAIWRQFYQGIPPSKSQRAQVTDAVAMLETRSEVDKDEAELNGNLEAFRLSEAVAFVEGLNQTMAKALIYGNQAVNPEQFNGLAPRYSAISGAGNAQNVISGGGSGNVNTSIYLVVWGENTVTGIYPKGSTAGLQHEDLGVIDAFDENNARYRAYADRWSWKCGLHVKDWRYAVRICNIDTTDLLAQTGTQAATAATAIINLMIKAFARIPFPGMGNAVFYANRTIKEMLSIAAMNKSANALGIESAVRQFGGVDVSIKELKFLGIPIRTVDVILNNEATVV